MEYEKLNVGNKLRVDNASGVEHLAEIVGKTGTIVGIDTDVPAWEYGYKVDIDGEEYLLYPWEVELLTYEVHAGNGTYRYVARNEHHAKVLFRKQHGYDFIAIHRVTEVK